MPDVKPVDWVEMRLKRYILNLNLKTKDIWRIHSKWQTGYLRVQLVSKGGSSRVLFYHHHRKQWLRA